MPLRQIGSVTRTILPNEVGSPPQVAYGGATLDPTCDVTINAVNEGAALKIYVPSQWRRIGTIYLYFEGLVAGLINFSTDIIGGETCTDSGSGIGPQLQQLTTILGGLHCLTLTVATYDPALAASGAWIYIIIDYSAAGGGGIATNILFRGAVVTEA